MIAHFDINNCYCSIEAVFNPKLRGKPTVVLGNGDGCVVARSAESKALGIKMGEPYHLIAEKYRPHGVIALSSNYALYGDMSQRVMDTARTFAESFSQYSIDEGFLFFSPGADLNKVGAQLRAKILRYTGLTVSVGIAPTKVLAKAANRISKKNPSLGGVFRWPCGDSADALLASMKPSDVWGIAGRLEARLEEHQIRNALDLAGMKEEVARRVLSVTGLRIVLELRGVSCMDFDEVEPARKSIMCSRSFGAEISTIAELQQAAACYAENVGSKLRRHGLAASTLHVFAASNPFKPGQEQFSRCVGFQLETPTNDSIELVRAATTCTRQLFVKGRHFKRVGVMVVDLVPEKSTQLAFASPSLADIDRRRRLMATMDSINSNFGRGSIRSAHIPPRPIWVARASKRSPRYTTRIDEIPIAYA